MIFPSPEELGRRIREVSGRFKGDQPQIIEDTSDFMSIDEGGVLRLDGNDYLVMGNAREGRFGIDEQPKFWVKNAIDLTTRERKIIKLVFHESFTSRIGADVFHCVRNPEKEAAILREMQGDPHFMQGISLHDVVGNIVRVIDFIPGPSLFDYLRRIEMPHEKYYHELFGSILKSVIACIEALARLHSGGMHHGDIRADHILLFDRSSRYVWIDFDYEISHPEYDLFCLGNIISQVAGKGRHSQHDISQRPSDYPDFKSPLDPGDMSLMFPHRVANLGKLFPHLSPQLSDILAHFSAGATNRYRSIDELLTDLHRLDLPG
ncbi:MAG: protein kinase [Thermodesulfobacteriota bacterium]